MMILRVVTVCMAAVEDCDSCYDMESSSVLICDDAVDDRNDDGDACLLACSAYVCSLVRSLLAW